MAHKGLLKGILGSACRKRQGLKQIKRLICRNVQFVPELQKYFAAHSGHECLVTVPLVQVAPLLLSLLLAPVRLRREDYDGRSTGRRLQLSASFLVWRS